MATDKTPQVWAGPPYNSDVMTPQVFADPSQDDAPPALTPLGMSGGAPHVFANAPDMPTVSRTPTPLENQVSQTDQALRKLQYKDANPYGSANNHPGVGGKILHALSVAGNIAGDIFAPAQMATIDGTTLNRKVQEGGLTERLQGLTQSEDAEKQAEAQRAQEQATTDYTKARPGIEQSKIDQKQQAVQDRVSGAAAKAGQKVTWDSEGVPTYQDDPDLQEYQANAAKMVLQGAQTEREQVLAQMGQPGSPMYEQKQRQLDQIDRRIGIAQQQLALHGAQFGLDKDKFAFAQDSHYNPEPTATQRTKADLAQSAVERIGEMRAIVAKHPEYFGPVAGRANNAQAWLGSSDPDAITYNTAAQYLADHSAGVFGGRGQYITQALHGITDPKYTPEGLNAALDEADRAAQGFVKAGKVHGAPAAQHQAQGGGAPAVMYARDPQGQLHQAPVGTALPQGWKEEKR